MGFVTIGYESMREREGAHLKYRPSSVAEVLAANLEAVMKRKGLTGSQVAKNAGCNASMISRILHERPLPSLKVVLRIAEAVDEDLGVLLTTEEIDSWLIENLPIFQRKDLEKAVKKLAPENKWLLLGLYHDIEEKRKTNPEEFGLLDRLSTRQKWNLRYVIEGLIEVMEGHK